ncbi:hypothetical protein DMC61_21975 [Amycolatopsis sp. WAC 04169]|uniref:hypothetical protein n=1 Tax=Amycolatopsis sp. WAC 04169 TaxID=2203197 RepID=UPI000F7A80B5|nr:hypothetical protein [Amycolatopsis sp. WAC 04169]RSN29170.1 hypothetical protein DMC61_21975 [Amycolatopsis sp. WAC 04169]
MNRIRYIGAALAGTAALLGLTLLGTSAAQASEATLFSNPPGACTSSEVGDWKTDRFGIIHICTYIDGGYYWIPL